MSPLLTHGSGLLLGAALGFVLQRGRFCVTGAFREVWTSGRTRWLTAYLIAIAVLSVGFFLLLGAGIVNAPSSQLPAVATTVGALIFGVGIVLAGGCATGTFYRSGEGLIGSWLALIMYAVSAAAMKYGVLAPINSGLREPTLPMVSVHDTLGISPWLLVVPFVAFVGYLTWRHLRAERGLKVATLPPQRTGLEHLLFEKPWHPFATAIVFGLIAIAAFPLSYSAGREGGLGITTPSANLAYGLVAGDVAKLVDWGTLLIIGIILGSFIAAKASGEFRLRVPDTRQMVRSLTGGVLMGVGASWAGGCTIGASLVGAAQFQWNGWLAFGGFFLGVGIAAKIFLRPKTSAPAGTSAPAKQPVSV